MKTKVAVQLSCKRLGRQKCGALEVPMPSCSICEQFLYLIKTQGRRRRLRRRLGRQVMTKFVTALRTVVTLAMSASALGIW